MNKNTYTWDLSALLKSDDDPAAKEKRKIIERKISAFVKKWKERDDYLEDPLVLKLALDEYEKLRHTFWPDGDEALYFILRREQNENDPKIKAKLNNVSDFSIKLTNDIQFFALKVAKIAKNKQKLFLDNPELSPYKHFLEKLFKRSDHLLSDAEEKILNLKDDVSYGNWVKMTSSFLAKESAVITHGDKTKKEYNFSEFISLMRGPDKITRDNAAKEFNKILEKYSDVAEIELNSVLANKKIEDELRDYKKPESARLMSDDIEEEIVDRMVKIVSDNFSVPNEFYKLKANLFGLSHLEYHERNLDYGKINKKYDLQEAIALIDRVTKKLDPEFNQLFQQFLDNNLIDVFPKKGKRGGAFCMNNLLTEPTFILLNYTGRLNDVTTFAHELGHGINAELMKKKQNALNFDTSLAVAEVASTFMEDFVLDEILKDADDDLRLGILINKLDNDVSTIFRQIACFQFERELHAEFRKKNYLPKEEIGKLFQKHMKAYMGDFVEQSPGSENWWVYWNHIRSYFYNYSYANGLLISKALQKIVKENPENIVKVKTFLSEGTSKSPRQIFKDQGFDISEESFWQNGIEEIKLTLRETERLIKKLSRKQ